MMELPEIAGIDAHGWLRRAAAADAAGDVATAERSYLQALALDANLVDARFGLGVTYFRSARYGDAARELQAVVSVGAADAAICLLLGKSLYLVGQFSESAEVFERASQSMPLQGDSLRCYARARTYTEMIAGKTDDAIAGYPALAGLEVEPIDVVIRGGFGLLSAYGHQAAAIRLGELLIAAKPDDATQRHLNDAVAGRAVDHVPPAYVEAHFDAFAEGFDDKLVNILGYRVPERMAGVVRRHRALFDHVLDLGCGTGLAGAHLRSLAGKLSGVDLSARMLEQAAHRGIYDTLTHAEALAHLEANPVTFDLVFAADTLIYFGRLDSIMSAVAQAMPSGGIFAASVERTTTDFALLPSGRFAHADDYVARCADLYFELLERQVIDIRLEANAPAKGALYVWRRR